MKRSAWLSPPFPRDYSLARIPPPTSRSLGVNQLSVLSAIEPERFAMALELLPLHDPQVGVQGGEILGERGRGGELHNYWG